jgi:hypothetical protein
MKKVLRRIHHESRHRIRSLSYKVRPLKDIPRRIIVDVPYFAQWESPELVEMLANESMDAADDPLWKRSGAKNTDEYRSWSSSACGMACTKMILAHSAGKVFPIVELGKEALKHGCYDLPLEASVGLKYVPYIEFVKQKFGLIAAIVAPMVREDIFRALAKGEYVMLSVTAEIRHPDSTPKRHGGHLVLAVGYDLDKKIIYINNPSGYKKETQDHAEVSFDDFEKFFAHKGIVISA